ncbi:hypothetical protein Fot_06342 [Forsythia ovata]|uniref:Uncharacterized protein n=1 Tax=Forsythia ovata TaxID=205694 RepID=A0ABD1WVP4_9LAMI
MEGPRRVKRPSFKKFHIRIPLLAFPDSSDWMQRINIGSRQDELDPIILERLPPLSAMAVASVHKYWTSVWAKATEGADLSKLIKMAEMNTAQSHVLNCKLYKVLVMKVDKLHSTVVGVEDINTLYLENQILRLEFTVFENARARAVYDITKYGTIQMMCA